MNNQNKKTSPKEYSRRVNSEIDVRYWIEQYKNYKSFVKVQDHLRGVCKKAPGISTLKNRITELIGKEEYKKLVKKYTFTDAKIIIKQIGITKTGKSGKILSNPEEFKGVKSKLKIQCGKCNHSWTTRLDAIIHNNSWCPNCAVKDRVENQRGSVREYQKIIMKKGGKVIKIQYEDTKENLFNQRARFEIECKNGHRFNINGSNLKQDKWCKECGYCIIGEKIEDHSNLFKNLLKTGVGNALLNQKNTKTNIKN